MGDAFKRNWKKLTSVRPYPLGQDDDLVHLLAAQTGISEVAGGGGAVEASYVTVASGLVANGASTGTVYTMSSDTDYIVGLVMASDAANAFTSGDEDTLHLVTVQAGIAVFVTSNLSKVPAGAGGSEFTNLKLRAGAGTASVQQGGAMDSLDATVNLVTGAVSLVHTDGGDGSNGLYHILAKE